MRLGLVARELASRGLDFYLRMRSIVANYFERLEAPVRQGLGGSGAGHDTVPPRRTISPVPDLRQRQAPQLHPALFPLKAPGGKRGEGS